jgi:glutathione S-transferase
MAGYKLIIGNRNYSSWSLRAWLLMRQFEIEFEELRLPLETEEFRAQISTYNPAGKVPVLCHGELRVPDTLAIAEYLAETHPEKHLWPVDREARANARSMCAEMHSSFGALRDALPMNCRASHRRVALDGAVARDIERIQTNWQACRQGRGPDGPWLFAGFSIVDAFYAPVASRFRTYGVSLAPVAQEYVEKILSLPAIREWYQASALETEVIEHEEVGR